MGSAAVPSVPLIIPLTRPGQRHFSAKLEKGRVAFLARDLQMQGIIIAKSISESDHKARSRRIL
jgi:hypothetical protein